jgi:hypothetical protein
MRYFTKVKLHPLYLLGALCLTTEAVIAISLALTAKTYAIQVNAEAYATRFCEVRLAGAGLQKSIDEALRASYSDSGIPTQVIRNGTTYNSDILAATDLVSRRCPRTPGDPLLY